MSPVLLIGLGLALVALVVLQVVGVRALQSWGVKPARGVLALRAANVTVVVAVVAFALWKMGS